MANGAYHFEALLHRIAEQHDRFLGRVREQAFETLKAENVRLNEELVRLRHALSAAKKSKAPPPVPPVPHLPGMANGSPMHEEAGGGGMATCTLNCPSNGDTADEDAGEKTGRTPATVAPDSHRLIIHVSESEKGVGNGHRDRDPAEIQRDSQRAEFLHSLRAPQLAKLGSGKLQFLETDRSDRSGRSGDLRKAGNGSLNGVLLDRSWGRGAIVGAGDLLGEDKSRTKARSRVRDRLHLEANQEQITLENFLEALRMRDSDFDLSREDVKRVMADMQLVLSHLPNGECWATDTTRKGHFVNVNTLAEMLHQPTLRSYLSSADSQRAFDRIMFAFNNMTVEEIIDEATRSNTRAEQRAKKKKRKCTFENALHLLIVLVTVVNIVTLGVSVDTAPRHVAWFLVECVSTGLYIFEVCYKLVRTGRGYFWGPSCRWNLLDLFVTAASIFELIMSLSLQYVGTEVNNTTAQTSKVARITMILRALRLVRLVRLVSVLRSPLLRDVTNMLVGFVIGIPALLCVLVFFTIMLYVIGLIFRLCFGPAEGQDLISICGLPDDVVSFSDPACKLHLMYGEEYFGTVSRSMFTIFRWMLFDFDSSSGKSVVLLMSAGFGTAFDLIFVAFMVVVVFGLFNIITAIFVESTIAGLKHNDVNRKYAQQYELNFVRKKLRDLVLRIQDLANHQKMHSQHPKLMSSPSGLRISAKGGAFGRGRPEVFAKFDLQEEAFVNVMEDPDVHRILQDLDCQIFNPQGLFETFDSDGDGHVTLPDIISAILKLRGDAQKNDIVASWVALKSLHEKFDKFQRLSLDAQRELKDGQRMAMHVLGETGGVGTSRPPSSVL